MNRKHEVKYHVNANVVLMVKNVTKIKRGTTVNAGVSVKERTHMCVKKIYLESC